MWLDGHRTALYRFYSEGGALLYVGITHDTEERFADHERLKPWWPQVAETRVEWFDNRAQALKAERRAIRNERPVHNVSGSPWAPGPRQLERNEVTQGQLNEILRGVQAGASIVDASFIVDRSKARRRVAVLVPVDWYRQALEDRARLESLEK